MMGDDDIRLSRSQALKIMAISVLIKDGDLFIRGEDEEDVANAISALEDAGEEIALQAEGYP